MIRSIQKISSFGVFENFQWSNELPDFKQFNLIYGWNYSGKTTLSRAFRCFEQKKNHDDFGNAQVQLKTEDGTIHSLAALDTAPIFRVFNSDFIRDNISFDNGSAEPILVLGEEDIERQRNLDVEKGARITLVLQCKSAKKTKEDKKDAIDKALTNYARNIKQQFSMVNYNKRDFEPKVKAASEQHLLNDAELEKFITVYHAKDKKPELSSKDISLSSVIELKEKAKILLARTVTANNPILRLKESSQVESWVNQGRRLHIGKNECQFCGQLLPSELINQLTGHFSADYENLMTELNQLQHVIKRAQEEEISLNHPYDFYTELSTLFSSQKDEIDRLVKIRHAALGSLITALTEKQTKAFTKLECPAIEDTTNEIKSVVEAINKIIIEHNKRTAEFDQKHVDAFTKIEEHYAATFVRDEQYKEQVDQIKELETEIIKHEKDIPILDRKIRSLEQELSDAAKGAERINQLLAAYFGKDDLQIKVSLENRFQIIRRGTLAKNLSEGEKTAIAFTYFITRVKDGQHPINDIRIVIDDPISSLDANHLFNTYALIKTQLSECRQLFISTHSFEFYNLIREWVADEEGQNHTKKAQAQWKKWGIFLIKQTDARKSVLQEIPKELLKFKSEYHYLFSTLYHFDKNGTGDFDCLLSLPNVVRRFMEAFGGIMIPLSTGLKGKMERLFSDNTERERVWKFINYYSHNTTITRSITIPDTSECKAVVKACLKAVSNWNSGYFSDLENEIL